MNSNKKPGGQYFLKEGGLSCQIVFDTIYLNREKDPKLPLNCQMAKNIPKGRNIIQMAIKYTNIFHLKTLQNLPILLFLV
jgi:hypothetical protein